MRSAEQARVAANDTPGPVDARPKLRAYARRHAVLFDKLVIPRAGREPPTARAVDRALRRAGRACVEDLTRAECGALLRRFQHVCAWCGVRLVPQGHDTASREARVAGLCARCWRGRT